MLNTISPARIGDLGRAYLAGGMGPGRAFTFGTVVIEKVLDMLCFTFLLCVLLLALPLPVWLSDPARALVITTMLGACIVVILAYQRERLTRQAEAATRWLSKEIQTRLVGIVQAGLSSAAILSNRLDLIKSLFWSGVIWGTGVLINHLILLALEIRLPLTVSVLTVVVLQVGITLPSMPGRIGVFEYLCVLTLALYGVDQSVALSYGILLHAITLVPTTLGGAIYWWCNSATPVSA
jgi:uncharacterized protein (TIRG00374 family)